MGMNYHFPEEPYEVYVKQAAVYHMNWPNSFGWAIFTVCDETGEFSIQSDWGNFSFRWNPKHLGSPSLHHFLAERGSFDYVVTKFSYGNEALKAVFDKKATLAELRKVVIERRRNHAIDEYSARWMWEDVERLCDEMDPYGLTDGIFYNPEFDEILTEFEDIWEYVHMCKPIVWYIVQDELLPRFAEYVRNHVLERS